MKYRPGGTKKYPRLIHPEIYIDRSGNPKDISKRPFPKPYITRFTNN